MSRMASKSPLLGARERILKTAANLFYRYGFRAVGIDAIIAESGVAKMSFYRHFPSKDALIVAYLNQSNAQFWAWFDEVRATSDNPRTKLELLFDAVAGLAGDAKCLGCTFTSAAAEFPDLDHPSHIAALQHKRQVMELLEQLATEAHARDPHGLAESLMLIMDGAWNAARMFGSGSHASRAAEAARVLISAQIDVIDAR
jgi:AcrR family transcriptional regulator